MTNPTVCRSSSFLVPLGLVVLGTACGPGDDHTLHAAGDTVRHSVRIQGNPAGEQLSWSDGEQRWFFFTFNDRGRGPELTTRIHLDAAGLPTEVEIHGHDYSANPSDETFEWQDGRASWRNPGESGSREGGGPAFYLAMNSPPGELALLARALLEQGGELDVLPSGTARIEEHEAIRVEVDDRSETVRLYAISGLDFLPSYVWLDSDGGFFASEEGWFSIVREGWESITEELREVQTRVREEFLGGLAQRLTPAPAGTTVIRDVRLVDVRGGAVHPGSGVVLRGDRITEVTLGSEPGVPDGAEVIEGGGRTLLPGLFDMHGHLSPVDGVLNLAAGVTSARDLANDIDALLELTEGFDSGRLLGPRVVRAGFMDGPGPFAGPTKILVDTEEEIREAVDRYAELGYEQIKMYSSIDPDLVPVIVDAAHGHGMRVSGHVPSGLVAEDAVRLGFDELQHANFLILNFLGDTLDTRTPLRFTAPGEHAALMDLDSPEVQAFVSLLLDRGVVVDPTLMIFEWMFTARPGEVGRGLAPIDHRLPPQVRRGLLSGGRTPPEELGPDRYERSFAVMRDFVGRLHSAGVPIVPGTDNMAGFSLHRELELYVEAGISPFEVLRLATLGSAEVVGREDRLGAVEAGMLADLILVDGDPTENISDIRAVSLVFKGGVPFDPAALHASIGVSGRE